jgi:hypothetical protein
MVVLFLAQAYVDNRLEATGGPGIVPYELSAYGRGAATILGEWGGHGRYLARISLLIDYGFIVAYGAFWLLAGLATRDFAREKGRAALVKAGRFAPYAGIVAACFDAGENAFLLITLGNGGESGTATAATACATVKFAATAIAVGYVLWGLGARLAIRRRAAPS